MDVLDVDFIIKWDYKLRMVIYNQIEFVYELNIQMRWIRIKFKPELRIQNPGKLKNIFQSILK